MSATITKHDHSLNPAAVNLYNQFGDAMIAGNKEAALNLTIAAAHEDPDYFAAQMMAGMMSHQAGRYDEAVEHFFHVLRIDRGAEFVQDAFLESIEKSESVKQKLISAERGELTEEDKLKAVMAILIVDDAFKQSARGDIVQSLDYLHTATMTDFQTAHNYINANLYDRGNPDKALFCGLAHLNTLKFVGVNQIPPALRRAMSLDITIAGKKLTADSFLEQSENHGLCDAFFIRAIELDPSSPFPEVNLSRWYDNIGDKKAAYDHAQNACDKLLLAKPRIDGEAGAQFYAQLDNIMRSQLSAMKTKLEATGYNIQAPDLEISPA